MPDYIQRSIGAMSDDTSADDLAFAEFPPADREQWLKLVAGVLKGASFEKRLVSAPYDGIASAPLYGRDAPARAVLARTARRPRHVARRIGVPAPGAPDTRSVQDRSS